MILVLWDLVKPCQKVTNKLLSSAAHEQNFTTLARSLGPTLPFPSTLISISCESLGQRGFKLWKSKMSDRLTQGHSSSSAPWQLLQDDLHPTVQTSSHLYSRSILSSSSQNLALPWTNKKLRKIVTLKCHQHSRESPFKYFYWQVWRQQKRQTGKTVDPHIVTKHYWKWRRVKELLYFETHSLKLVLTK